MLLDVVMAPPVAAKKIPAGASSVSLLVGGADPNASAARLVKLTSPVLRISIRPAASPFAAIVVAPSAIAPTPDDVPEVSMTARPPIVPSTPPPVPLPAVPVPPLPPAPDAPLTVISTAFPFDVIVPPLADRRTVPPVPPPPVPPSPPTRMPPKPLNAPLPPLPPVPALLNEMMPLVSGPIATVAPLLAAISSVPPVASPPLPPAAPTSSSNKKLELALPPLPPVAAVTKFA